MRQSLFRIIWRSVNVALVVSILVQLYTLFLLLVRMLLGWYADQRLHIPRFHLRSHLVRAGAAFFTTPEIK